MDEDSVTVTRNTESLTILRLEGDHVSLIHNNIWGVFSDDAMKEVMSLDC